MQGVRVAGGGLRIVDGGGGEDWWLLILLQSLIHRAAYRQRSIGIAL